MNVAADRFGWTEYLCPICRGTLLDVAPAVISADRDDAWMISAGMSLTDAVHSIVTDSIRRYHETNERMLRIAWADHRCPTLRQRLAARGWSVYHWRALGAWFHEPVIA